MIYWALPIVAAVVGYVLGSTIGYGIGKADGRVEMYEETERRKRHENEKH